MKTVLFVLLDQFADWESAFLAPALRGGIMPGRPGSHAVRYATPGGVPVRSIGGMTLTPEVTSSMSCSNAYCNNAQVVIVPADQADKYQTAEDCADLVFAAEAGSAGEAEVTALGYECTPVQSQAAALMEVAAGTCDAAVIDSLMAAAMVGEGTSYENLTYTVQLNSEEYGVGFRTGSDLADALNEFFKAAYEDGSLLKTAETYGVQAALIEQK